ncbi:unnamed protein product [Peronospora destructor]|uniref:DNA2/NAM7 helicase-like C-terminal domain-containing protein n=1 Tax=Peronospora destructor TaxID=86335 RepID=A0AAV0TPQ4_9STRA|nr:unnamed protein product [Peronospora destructor]
MVVEADSSLNIRLKTHRSVRGRLTTLLNEMEKTWSIRVKAKQLLSIVKTRSVIAMQRSCAHIDNMLKGTAASVLESIVRDYEGHHPSTRRRTSMDGFISQVKYDGTISIDQVASRRPPLKPIHWKTTKRLSSPNLVGVVRVANRDASLRSSDEIYWGEIIFQGKSFDEFKAREKGCLTLRLLQYLDEPGNAMLAHNPSVGNAVAIIDCQTFVSEFIPVLKALEKQRQMPMPFQDGALLNLCDQMTRDTDDGNDYYEDVELTTGVSSATGLLSTRLDLRGPPGTGKSYLGVVIVRALLVIRDLWKQKNLEIGDPPILVLSYKNHAIDEFLLDLLRSEPTLGHVPRTTAFFGRYYLGNGFKRLVRIGGGCNEPELEQYRERNVAASDPDALNTEELKIVQGAVPAVSSAVATLLRLTKSMKTIGDAVDNPVQAIDGTNDKENSDLYKLLSETPSPIETVESVVKEKPMLTNKDIALLYEGIKHYDRNIDPQEVVYKWISGFCPLPACTYAELCLKVCVDGSNNFCQQHSCQYTQDEEYFCSESELADIASHDPPRNSCERHPLCWGLDIPMCSEIAEPTKSHCKLRVEDLYCKWIAERGESCSEIASTGQYCGKHHVKAAALAARIAETSDEKCQVRTRKGKACKAKPLSGLHYCRDHVGRTKLPSTKPPEISDEVEESEHLQHLRDVLEVEDNEVEEATVEEIDEEEKSAWTLSDQQLVSPYEWHWEMTLEERWNALYSVLDLWSNLNAYIRHAFVKELENLKIELQREILRANSRVYEGKAVIGGTITGCVSRLEAIRTTNPFAILVEEASEVMEPLLVSCFSSSTRKLEMIGDHMQLQPSVMGRIDFERVNKINISMFERLISAPQGNEVPSSVLSIQRRMRKNICDLTRNYYREITPIEDHETCGTKVIGSKSKGNYPLLDACEGDGREVPGVAPHVFFWTHSGAQERASVGLSRVNQQEAKMTCKLVHYLVLCGVPPKSIAVLTPYKGQLMLLRKILMNTYKLTMMTKGRDSRLAPSCTVSTVDRFQGDEADIIVISLVIDGKSRTPFVKLQNRMIVLLSRARLGMYVVGNVEYFGETTHWQKTLGLLEIDAESDNTNHTECTTYSELRIGRALPI